MDSIIQTSRLYLRPIVLSDAEDMLELHSDEEVQRYTGEVCIDDLEVMKMPSEQGKTVMQSEAMAAGRPF